MPEEGSAMLSRDIKTNEEIDIGDTERRSGLYVLGKPGMGKSNFLLNLAFKDVLLDHGLFFLDPHGDAINDFMRIANISSGKNLFRSMIEFRSGKSSSVQWEKEKTYLLDPENEKYSFGINPLYCRDVASLHERTDTYTRAFNVFHKIWEEDWGVWLQLIIQNTLYTFIENQDYTLAEVPLFYTNENFRYHLVKNIKYNTDVKDFWLTRFEGKRDIDQQRQVDAALTRISTLLGHPYIKHIVGQKQTTIDFSKAMEDRKIILVRLSSAMASDMVKFIGTILLSELLHAVRERPADKRGQFCIFIDEMQNFASSEDLATLITEARKFGIATTLAHQERYGQLGDNKKMLGATLAAANKIFFQLTVKDAQELASEFAEKVEATETRREEELNISEFPAQDLYRKGHPAKDYILELACHKCLYLADLLDHSKEEYYLFDPKRFRPEYMKNNHNNLHWDTFNEWGMYRASRELLIQGIDFLNYYFLEWMEHRLNGTELAYNKSKPIGDHEIMQILGIILDLGGVMGFYPAMQPYIPDDMRQLLAFRINEKNERRIREIQQEYHAGRRGIDDPSYYRHESADFRDFPGLMDKYINSDIKKKYPELVKQTTIDDIPDIVQAGSISWWRDHALFYGFSSHECEKLIQWKKMEILPELAKPIISLIESTANMGIKGNAENLAQISQDFVFAMLMYCKLFYPVDFVKSHTDQIVDRSMWQIAEIMSFVTYLRAVGSMLSAMPIKTKSGVYTETVRMERTQIDIVNEMVQELSSLPRFIAYAKILEGDTVKKHKIKTHPLEELEPHDFGICEIEMYCKSRETIEQEIADRQARWKAGFPTLDQAIKSYLSSSAGSSTPPPTRT
jgi:hypothetical protein